MLISGGYVYSFGQIFQGVRLFKGVRLFQTLEYTWMDRREGGNSGLDFELL